MKNRKLSVVLALFILFALPAISVYYSSRGLKFRINTLQDLKIKGTLPVELQRLIPADNYTVLASACEETAYNKPLIDQFKNERIQFVFFRDSSMTADWENEFLKRIQFISDSSSIKLLDLEPCQWLLLDEKYNKIYTYQISKESDRTKLIEHLALLVTRKKQ